MTGTAWQDYSEISGAPAADDTLLILQKSDTSANAAGTVHEVTTAGMAPALIGMALPVYYPSGDTSGVDDPGNINTILAAGDPVVLLPMAAGNNYYVKTKITPVTGSFLGSWQYWAAANNDNYGAGIGGPGAAVLWQVAAFSDAYAIDLYNTTGTQAYGADIAGLLIYGEAVPGASAPGGIRVHGAWGAGFIRGVGVVGVNGDCIHFEGDSGTGKVPDEWRLATVKLSGSYAGYGVYAANLPDSSFTDVHSSGQALDAWYFQWSTNTRLVACKAENSSGAGFHFTGQGGSGDILWLDTCTTHLNQKDGFLFDNAGGGSGGGLYQLSNCGAVADGHAGGTTYGGYRSNGCTDLIMATGCSAQGAYYGAAEIGSSLGMYFTGSYLRGSGANTYDDGSNTTALANVVPVGGPYPFPAAVTTGVVTLAYASTMTPNAAAGDHFAVTLTGNATMAAPTSPPSGPGLSQKITFELIQDGTGGRTVTWNSAFDFGSAGAPALTATASKRDLIGFAWSPSASKWLYAGIQGGL